ncbi:MAG: tRNA (adenosine(37)-N6)-dimethylallyltransferase MiaA [bacterium]|nr:tRNA (adenosine(37)-N6)-dimethylallyltransferase MiaA [bacterium]
MTIDNAKPKLVVIVGPTASGKTALSLKLAKKFRGEIVSADSRAVYKYLNIGSAKPSPKERQGVRHHLLDVVKPNETLSLAQYKELATKAILDIQRHGKLPILVGGTALYIYAVIDNWLIPEVPPNEKLRARLEKQSAAKLFQQLLKKDPEAKNFIDPQNKRRIIRALEIIAATKKPFSQQRAHGPQLFDTLILGVKKEADETKKNITKRTQQMLKTGLVIEVKKLLKKGYSPSSPALSGIHYKEIIDHLEGKMTLAKAVALINKNDEQLVRRQMTWFKKDSRIRWVKNQKEAEKLVKKLAR